MEKQFFVFSGIPYVDKPLFIPENFISAELNDNDGDEENGLPESLSLQPMP
jgi:hypothetical protein